MASERAALRRAVAMARCERSQAVALLGERGSSRHVRGVARSDGTASKDKWAKLTLAFWGDGGKMLATEYLLVAVRRSGTLERYRRGLDGDRVAFCCLSSGPPMESTMLEKKRAAGWSPAAAGNRTLDGRTVRADCNTEHLQMSSRASWARCLGGMLSLAVERGDWRILAELRRLWSKHVGGGAP